MCVYALHVCMHFGIICWNTIVAVPDWNYENGIKLALEGIAQNSRVWIPHVKYVILDKLTIKKFNCIDMSS